MTRRNTFATIERFATGGGLRCFELRKPPVREEDGKISGIQTVLCEVTGQKVVEAALDEWWWVCSCAIKEPNTGAIMKPLALE